MSSPYPKTKEQRAKMFTSYDPNGNGIMSLAELDRMIETEKCFEQYNIKPVIMRAYKKADTYGKMEGLITRLEFAKFLEYLPIYHRLWDYFDKVDVDNDRRVDLAEFKAGAKEIGLNLSNQAAEAMFRQIDSDQGGMILFDEFCEAMIDKAIAEMKDEE